MNLTKQVKSLADLEKLGQEIASKLETRQLVLIEGPLGSGKTEFVRAILKAIGSKEAASPTFAIHHTYQSAQGEVDHVDLYRLTSARELEDIGFWELFSRERGLILVEWADRLSDSAWPRDWSILKVAIRLIDEGTREITLQRVSC